MMDDGCLPLVTVFTFDFLINVGDLMCLLILSIAIMSLLAGRAARICARLYANVVFCMCWSRGCQTILASKWALAPHGEGANLNIHRTAYEFSSTALYA